MGNREDLLAAAKRCLYEKGYARTTARDIATAAGVSLAAIGYHYGSKEALLNAALRQAIEEWGADLARILAVDVDPGAGSAEVFEATWTRIAKSFGESRPLWAVQFELLAHLERAPELRETFPASTREARLGLAELFGEDVTGDEDAAATVGALYQALLIGMAALSMSDPATAPSGADLVEALRLVSRRVAGPA